jgi:hypothetical protein
MTSSGYIARSRRGGEESSGRKRCTGPRTREGKARSRKNALKHALNVRASSYPVLEDRADAIVAGLLPEWEHPELLELAWGIAAAQVEVERVMVARAQFLAEVEEAIAKAAHTDEDDNNSLEDCSASSVSELLKKLEKLDRYTRRTLSRRKFAIREFDEAQRAIQKRHEEADRCAAELKYGRVRPMYLPEGSLASLVFFANIR